MPWLENSYQNEEIPLVQKASSSSGAKGHQEEKARITARWTTEGEMG